MGADDVVLAQILTGNFLAGIVPGASTSVTGSRRSTSPASSRRWPGLTPRPSTTERLRFLLDRQIRFVVYGPHERAIGAPMPDALRFGASLLEPVYDVDGVAIYQVRLTGD